jgi:protein gp37
MTRRGLIFITSLAVLAGAGRAFATAARWRDLTGTARPEKPWLDGQPRLIFLNDMGDTFTASLPLDWLAPELPRMASSPHQWLILTKRPDRAAQFAARHPLPDNVWVGASLTETKTLARLRALQRVRASRRFLSVEPWLGPAARLDLTGIAWIILGGESGPGARPVDLSALRDFLGQCRAAGVAVFVKQLGSVWAQVHGGDPKGGDWTRWPADLRIRKFPAGGHGPGSLKQSR